MNLSNTFRTENLIVKNDLKATIMGILLIGTTFFMTSNINGTAFTQASNTISGANKVRVTIPHLPNQTSDASSEATLSNIGPNDDRGQAKTGDIVFNFSDAV